MKSRFSDFTFIEVGPNDYVISLYFIFIEVGPPLDWLTNKKDD